jgi:hypothetical protein
MGGGVTKEIVPKAFADLPEDQQKAWSGKFKALVHAGKSPEEAVLSMQHDAERSIHHRKHHHRHHDEQGDGFEKRGVTLLLFQRVQAVALEMNPDPNYWDIGRIAAYVIGNHEIVEPNCRYNPLPDPEKTLTYSQRSSLVDLLQSSHHSSNYPHEQLRVFYGEVVGHKADIFISFAYNSNFIELVDGLQCFFEENPTFDKNRTCFWFDLFVNNQWQALDHDFNWWATTFRTAVQDIGHTVCFLCPWSGPEMLTRAWCLYEISCSKRLSITMSKKQIENFRETLCNSATHGQVEEALCKIDLKNSKAWCVSDKDRIFEVVDKSEKGFQGFNAQVMTLMRHWISETTLKLSADLTKSEHKLTPKEIDDLANFADELKASGKLEEAKDLYERAMQGS